MSQVIAILSMLHEPTDRNSAGRQWRGGSVLAQTVCRVAAAQGVDQIVVVCWDDQAAAARAALEEQAAMRRSGGSGFCDERDAPKDELGARNDDRTARNDDRAAPLDGTERSAAPSTQDPASLAAASLFNAGRRIDSPAIAAHAAADRWTDGWRGGPGGACAFDRGFVGDVISRAAATKLADLQHYESDVQTSPAGGPPQQSARLLLVDPAAALVDPHLLEELIQHATAGGHEFAFSAAAPGLSGVILSTKLTATLAAAGGRLGQFLSYLPDKPSRDPIAGEQCVPVPTSVARSPYRFLIDSDRQASWLGEVLDDESKGVAANDPVPAPYPSPETQVGHRLHASIPAARLRGDGGREPNINDRHATDGGVACPAEPRARVMTATPTAAPAAAPVAAVPPAHHLVAAAAASTYRHTLPREIVIELTTRRRTRPIFSPLGRLAVDRPDMDWPTLRRIIEQSAEADDIRLTFGGVGDPLLHERFADAIQLAQSHAIGSIAVETDLLTRQHGSMAASHLPESQNPADNLPVLASGGIDIVSVMIPAQARGTYAAVMGSDRLGEVVENVRRLVELRAVGGGLPVIIPTFVKLPQNLAEMEGWYDQWLRALGSAVILGPTDAAGELVDLSVARMDPPRRRPCGRLARRMVVRSTGQVTACEEDVRIRRPLGDVNADRIIDIWTQSAARMAAQHSAGRWDNPLCAGCNHWHRS